MASNIMYNTSVLIVRTKDKLKETSAFFTKAGFSTAECPISKIVPQLVNIDDTVDGFIITSSSALLSIRNTNLPFFCVGANTASKATELGFRVIYSGDEDAQSLAEYISKVYPPEKLIHAAGDIVDKSWYKILEKEGFEISYKQAYSTEYIENLPENVVSAIKGGTISVIAFMSVMGAKTFIALASKCNLDITNITAIAISNNVADNLHGIKNIKIADKANLDSMLSCLNNISIK